MKVVDTVRRLNMRELNNKYLKEVIRMFSKLDPSNMHRKFSLLFEIANIEILRNFSV